jgi:hypothetical protein
MRAPARVLHLASVPGPLNVSLLHNRFTMAVGETVIAGTSRVGSGEALVVLLTALPQSALRWKKGCGRTLSSSVDARQASSAPTGKNP